MGTEITLYIESLLVDFAKNCLGNDHSVLYNLPEDIKIKKECIEQTHITNEFCTKHLSLAKDRLNLLGYSIPEIKNYFVNNKKTFEEEYSCKILLSFRDFYGAISNIDIPSKNFSIDYENFEDYDLYNYIKRSFINNSELKSKFKLINNSEKDPIFEKNYLDEHTFIVEKFLETFAPYVYLRLLAENKNNNECKLVWDFGEIVQNGWIKRTDAIHPLSPENKIIIVTEGYTDSFIIKNAINHLYPNIKDFFEFIDMKENYPFTGTGNLSNFCMGLNKINIQNKVIILFDNDTEGCSKFNELISKVNSKNILITKLPFLEEFTNFSTIGPQGESVENINNRAVSIECFLDLSAKKKPQVRWTNYNEKVKQYQGSILNKDDYTRYFKKCITKNKKYDFTKLKILIDYIIDEWINFSSNVL